MAVPIVFAAVLSLLMAPAEKPLCCYATERGWIVHELGSPELHILRLHYKVDFTKLPVLMSGKLTPSNLVNHKLSALVIDDRLIVEYDKDFDDGFFPARLNDDDPRCRGECSIKHLFDGKVADQKGQQSDLLTKIVNPTITGDLMSNSKNEIFAVNCYEAADKPRVLGWFKDGSLKKGELPLENFKVTSPFKGYFKVFLVNERYFFITDRGILYSSLIDNDGKPIDVKPVFLGFGEPITAVASIVGSKRVFVFTRNRYFELGNIIPSPKQFRDCKQINFLKPKWLANDLTVRTKVVYYYLVHDKVIDPIKIDLK